MAAFAVIICALGTAINVALYMSSGSLFSLGAAIVCGCLVLFNLVMAAKS